MQLRSHVRLNDLPYIYPQKETYTKRGALDWHKSQVSTTPR